MLGMPGDSELLIISFVVLMLFGGQKLPELMRGNGKGVGELKKGNANLKKPFIPTTQTNRILDCYGGQK